MEGINILVSEHENVLKFCDSVKEKCINNFKENDFEIQYFEKVLDFGRNFVDKFHHKKEEDILFVTMMDELGNPIKNIIENGMLFDHQVGRMLLMNLDFSIDDYKMHNNDENKLKVISYAYNYANLMKEHIAKENEVLYPFAENNLNKNAQNKINNEISEYEENGYKNGTQNKYLNLLNGILKCC